MDTTELLLAQLMQGYAGQGDPRRDPFSPTQAGVDVGDANAAVEGTGHSAESEQWAKEFAGELGIDHKELLKPASGPIARQLGVEGVTPDFGALKKAMLNIVKGHEDMAKQGGPAGAPPENPQLRSALAYQQLQQSGQRLGGLGGQLINNLGPLIGPRMVAPYLEQQQQAAQQAAQLKAQVLLAETASKGALRDAQTRKALADAKLAEEKAKIQTLTVGKKKYQFKGSPEKGGLVFDPDTGLVVDRIEPTTKPLMPTKPQNRIDEDGNTYSYVYKNSDYQWNDPDNPEGYIKRLVKVGGSAGERKDLAKLYTMAKSSLEEIPKLYKAGLTGPNVGRALEARKVGGVFTQPLGAIAAAGMLNDEDLKQAVDLKSKLETVNAAMVQFWSGAQVSPGEMERRRNSLAQMTDYDADFLPHLKEAGQFMDQVREELEKRNHMGLNGVPLTGPPSGDKFIGKPSTGGRAASQGIIAEKAVEELNGKYGY